MSGEFAVSFALKLNDQGSGPATQALAKITKGMKEVGETAKSTSTAAISAFQKLATSREILGIRSEKVIQSEIKQTEAAYRHLADSGQLSARELGRAWDKSRESIVRLKNEMGILTNRQRMERIAKHLPAVGTAVYTGERTLANPVAKYAALEQAQTELRISMTNKNGKVSGYYDKTLAVAQELGNKLPGSTRDFVLEAQALKQMGIDDSVISGGGLRAAGMLRVGMGLQGTGEAGSLVAKSMHSFGLKDSELEGAADHTYRLHKAFGTKGQEITEANTYMGGTLNQLGWTGAEAMKKVQAMQGMLAMKGLDSSVFGTNFADMLSFAARNETRMKGKGAETKEVNEILGRHGIKLDLFDKKGKFVGPDDFVKQLEKLQVLNQKEQVEVFHKMFGTQGERVATALVNGGTSGVKAAEEKIDNIISLADAVKQQTETFSGKTEALMGSVENMLANIGDPIANSLKPVIDKLNEFTGAATDFFKDNPLLAAATGLATAGAAAAGAAGLVTMFLSSGVGLPVRIVGGSGMPDLPGGPKPTVPGEVAERAKDSAMRLGPFATGIAAAAPLVAMGGVALAADWTEKPGNAEKLLDFGHDYGGGQLKQLLAALGFDKDSSIEARRAQNREGLDTSSIAPANQTITINIDGNKVAEVVNSHNSRLFQRH